MPQMKYFDETSNSWKPLAPTQTEFDAFKTETIRVSAETVKKSELVPLASKNDVDTKILALGQLKLSGQFDTLAALQAAVPTGTADMLYLVIADGFTYRWLNGAWTKGAQFQAQGIGERTVTEDKTTFAKLVDKPVDGNFTPVNIFNVGDYLLNTTGYYMDPATGKATTSQYTTGYLYTKPIEVFPNMKYIRKKLTSAIGPVIYFDANNTFISGLNLNNASVPTEMINGFNGKVFVTPPNCKYIVLDGYTDRYADDFLYQMETASTDKAIVIEKLRISENPEIVRINNTMTALNNSVTTIVDTNKLKGAVVVNFADSLFGNYTAPTDISSYIAKYTGANVINVGFGGTRMGEHYTPSFDAFCMYKLVDSIIAKNFSLQESYLASDTTLPAIFRARLDALKAIDFNKIDIITFNHGTNDWGGNKPSEIADTPYNPQSYRGAMRYVLEKLMTAYPKLKVLLITPLYRFDVGFSSGKDSDTAMNGANGYLLPQYVTAMKAIAQEFKVPCCDMYYESGIHKFNRDYFFNSATDKVHPNEKGREQMARKIVGEMIRNF